MVKEILWNQYEELMQTSFNSPYASITVQGKKYTDNAT